MRRMLELGQVSRSSFYRFDPDHKASDRDMDLRDEIQTHRAGVALLRPAAHHRRIAAPGLDGESTSAWTG